MHRAWNVSHGYTCAPRNCQYLAISLSRRFALCIPENASSSFAISAGLRACNTEEKFLPTICTRIWKSILRVLWKNIPSVAREKTLSRDNALLKSSRCHRSRRVRSKVSIQRLYSGKVGNRKVWQSEESRKTLSETRGPGATRQAGALRRRRSTCIQILGKYPGYPAGKERADNTFLGIELLSMPVQLQRRLSPRTCRRNTRTRKRPREIFILPFFPQKYHRHRSAENESAYFRAPRRRCEKFSSPNSSLTKKKSALEREEMKQIVLSHGPAFSFSASLVSYRSFAEGEKSVTGKRLVMERLGPPRP